MRHLTLAALLFAFIASTAGAVIYKSGRVPPQGIPVPPTEQLALQAGVAALGQEIQKLNTELKDRPALLDLVPDVQIYYNAVDYSLRQNTFYKSNEFVIAKALLNHGMSRARELLAGNPGWINSTGLVVRGYVSKIDGSVQPYGLVIPSSWQAGTTNQFRLDFWLHGRGDQQTEISFINERQTKPGQFTPPDTFVLHAYGRYCNAYKFAGEADIFEALEHASKHYPIDSRRIAVRGFSMGGAATWHLAVHHAGVWAAAQPGAGFVETKDYQKLEERNLMPPWYIQKLWLLTDATEYAGNLFQCPTLAYEGEIDPQRASAVMMRKEMEKEGLKLEEIIGPNTAHKFEPKAKELVDQRMNELMAKPKNMVPPHIRFTTYTLAYNQMNWVILTGLGQHWERARVNADITGASQVALTTENVTALTLQMPDGLAPLTVGKPVTVTLDGQALQAPAPTANHAWTAYFEKSGTNWVTMIAPDEGTLRKRPGLQGPIDDAFNSSFLVVRPTGAPLVPQLAGWVQTEQNESILQWWMQFRGIPRVKNDSEVTDADIAQHNLILWGDPKSNKLIGRILRDLPIHWNVQTVTIGDQTYPANRYLPVLVFPNPLNPKRYVVLNSGFTFQETAGQSNAEQTPKLPDWAVIDTTVPKGQRIGKAAVTAGFFDEHWKVIKPPETAAATKN